MQYLDSFLESALPVLFTSETGSFNKYALSGYVSDRVMAQLADSTTVSDVIAECRAMNAIDECFEEFRTALGQNWHKVLPTGKPELIALIRQYGLEDQFAPHVITLSEIDKEALKIRWDISDMAYEHVKKVVLGELEGRRIDLTQQDAPRLVAPDDRRILFDSLLVLLRNRADIDLSVIAVTAPNLRRQFLSHVRYRCRLEFRDFLLSVRATMEKAYYDWQRLQGFSGSGVPYHVQTILDPFIRDAQSLIAKITGPIANPEIFDRVRKVLADPQNPNLTINFQGSIEMSKYKITGGQQVNVGDAANAQNFVQQQTVGTSIDIPDLLAFSQELSKIRSEAQKRASTPDELRATAELAEAEAAAKSGDKSKVIEKLKLAGGWVLGVAKDIGSSVAAKVIAQTLGLPG